MDINIPRLDGIAATRRIKNSHPHIAVVGLSVNAHGYLVDAMLKAGAFEVLSKEKTLEDLYSAIQRAVASIQPILLVECAPGLVKSHAELDESANLNPQDVSQTKESQEVTERESGSEN
jgi:DNA-binding NarL/FixJ family response regulator